MVYSLCLDTSGKWLSGEAFCLWLSRRLDWLFALMGFDPCLFPLVRGVGPPMLLWLACMAWGCLAVDCVLWLFVLWEWALVFYACPCAFLCGFMCVFCACLITLPCVLLCHVWPDSCCGGGLTGWCCGWLSGCPYAWLCLPLCFGL